MLRYTSGVWTGRRNPGPVCRDRETSHPIRVLRAGPPRARMTRASGTPLRLRPVVERANPPRPPCIATPQHMFRAAPELFWSAALVPTCHLMQARPCGWLCRRGDSHFVFQIQALKRTWPTLEAATAMPFLGAEVCLSLACRIMCSTVKTSAHTCGIGERWIRNRIHACVCWHAGSFCGPCMHSIGQCAFLQAVGSNYSDD